MIHSISHPNLPGISFEKSMTLLLDLVVLISSGKESFVR